MSATLLSVIHVPERFAADLALGTESAATAMRQTLARLHAANLPGPSLVLAPPEALAVASAIALRSVGAGSADLDRAPRVHVRLTVPDGSDTRLNRRLARLRRGRRFADRWWRGSPGFATLMDETDHPAELATLAREFAAERLLVLRADMPRLDPDLVRRVAAAITAPDGPPFVAVTVAPGLAPWGYSRALLEELAANDEPVGWLDRYDPELPRPDLLDTPWTIRLEQPTAGIAARLLADGDRGVSLLGTLDEPAGPPANGGPLADSADDARSLIARLLAEPDLLLGPIPDELEVELVAADSHRNPPPLRGRVGLGVSEPMDHAEERMVFGEERTPHAERAGHPDESRPAGVEALEDGTPLPGNAPENQPRVSAAARVVPALPMAEAIFTRVATDLAARSGRARIVFIGRADPLLHPAWDRLCQRAREAGVFGLAVVTSSATVVSLDPEQVLSAGFDVITIRLPTPAERAVRSDEPNAEAREAAAIERLLEARERRPDGGPVILISIRRARSQLASTPALMDHWSSRADGVVIEPWPAKAAPAEEGDLLSVEPRPRGPCRRLAARMTVRADGLVVSCSEDERDEQPLGRVDPSRPGEWLTAWTEGMVRLRARHAAGDWTEGLPACAGCREWHRP